VCSDVTAGAAAERPASAGLEIRISIETKQPLTGSAVTGGNDPVPFVGWLELLRVIADLAETADGAADVSQRPPEHDEGDGSVS
jgi:hypothetical protein